MHFMKAKLLLLSVAVVWAYIIIVLLPIMLPVTLLAIPFEGLRRYRYAMWISTDQLVNAIHNGNPDITVSSKVGYMAEQGSKTATTMAAVINSLWYIGTGQRNHCIKAIERDEEHY